MPICWVLNWAGRLVNPYLRRAGETNANTKSHKRAKKQEKEIATRIGGKLVPRSGAGDTKGDCRIRGILRIEAKTTKHKSFSITQEMLDKIEEAATETGEMPVIVVEFNEGGRKVREIAVCPTYVLDALCAPKG